MSDVVGPSRPAGEPVEPDHTPAKPPGVDQVLLALATGAYPSRAAQGVIRAARALKRAQDDQLRAMAVGDLNTAIRAAERAREAEAALLRAVARLPKDESTPRPRLPGRQGWEALALG